MLYRCSNSRRNDEVSRFPETDSVTRLLIHGLRNVLLPREFEPNIMPPNNTATRPLFNEG